MSNLNQTNSLENIEQENTSNIVNLRVDPKESTENKPSKKKNIIMIITIIILILIIIGLVIFIVLREKKRDDDDDDKLPNDSTELIPSDTSEDISQPSDSKEPKISDSPVSDSTSITPNPIPSDPETISNFFIINTWDISSDTI